MNMSKQLQNYYNAVEDLTKLFCKRYFKDTYEYDVNDWVASDIGGVICINDYFFNIKYIETAIKHKATKKELFDYYIQTNSILSEIRKNQNLNTSPYLLENYASKIIISFENYLRYFRGFSFEEIEANLSEK